MSVGILVDRTHWLDFDIPLVVSPITVPDVQLGPDPNCNLTFCSCLCPTCLRTPNCCGNHENRCHSHCGSALS